MSAVVTDNLPLLAAAPDGIDKLRGFILEFAFRGKLVAQLSSDDPASKLLHDIQVERNDLIREGKIRPSKAVPVVRADQLDCQLPQGWEWSHLGEIANIFNGNSISATEKEARFVGADGRPYIATKDVGYGRDTLAYENGVRIPESESVFKVAHAGAVLICAEGGSAGKKCGITDREICFGNKLFAAETYGGIPARLLLYFYLSPTFRSEFSVVTTGIIGGVSIAKFTEFPIPLAPLAEQRRIVAKVDQLMALCDQLESQQADAESAHAQLVDALLGSLTQVHDSDDFAASWQRLSGQFHTLFTTESSIDSLKQTLLQLAVMGKLVPQDPDDAPAAVCYSQQRDLPEGYVRSGKQRIKEKPLLDPHGLPSIPRTWVYKTVDQLYRSGHLLDYADGNHGSSYPRKEEFSDDGVLFVTAAQITADGSVSWEDCPKLSQSKALQLTKGWAKLGDVFYTHNATVGRTALAIGGPQGNFLLGTSVTFYRINDGSISSNFLFRYFSSLSWVSQAERVMRQTTRNQVSITKQALFFVALPPLAEQHRIVAKVDQLMGLCDQLKASLTQARQLNEQLATTLVECAVT